MILTIENSPKTNKINEIILDSSFEINGRGIVSAKYNEMNETFTTNRLLNLSINFFKLY